MPKKQVQLNFDKMTKSGLSPLVKKFKKHKLIVADIEATNKGKRESGFLVKTAILVISDGQKVAVRVKADGTVFQVKLNNRVVPIKHVDDMNKAIIEIVDHVQDNAKKFAKARSKRLKKQKIGSLSPVPKVRTTRKQQIANNQEQVTALQSEQESLQEKIDVHLETNSSQKEKESRLSGELKELKVKEQTLHKEIKRLQAELKEAA